MTEEQIKQKAEKHADAYATPDLDSSFRAYIYEANKEGYIAGATENGIQWHDLRKDPNDLPEANWKNWVLAVYDNGILWCRARREVFTDGVYWVNSLHNVIHDVIMWARIEIPQFKGE